MFEIELICSLKEFVGKNTENDKCDCTSSLHLRKQCNVPGEIDNKFFSFYPYSHPFSFEK